MAKKNTVEETTDLAVVESQTTALAAASDEVDFGSDDSFSGDADKRSAAEVVLERFRIVQAMTRDKRALGLVDGQLYGNMTKKGLEEAIIVPIYDWKTIVERTGDDTGAFVAEYKEVQQDSGDFGDARINAYVKAAGIKDVHKIETDNGNKIGLTYNCLVAFLDAETGTVVRTLGVLQADKTNIRPYLLWRQNRVDFEGATKIPTYAFRTKVNGKGIYKNPDGKETQQYQFEPFDGKNWKTSLLLKRNLLEQLKAQRELMASGAIKVADVGDSDVAGGSESAQEAAAF
jgi:hypothetical protein